MPFGEIMAWKNLKQRSLADSMLIDHDAVKEPNFAHKLIDWDRLEHHLKDIHSSSRDEKTWPPLMMFKALLIQSWYKLSDSALEKQLARDFLFRRFIALDISEPEPVPDHSTFWRFRQKLDILLLMDKLLQEINSQLIDQGLYIKSGGISIVDASVIEAKQCRTNKDKDKHSTQDPDAKWNVKAGSDGKSKSTYGYKAHINVDEDGMIKSIGYTARNVHDSDCFN
ncbi:MAG: IS5 family transposase [Candidatus Endonucleobacter bathymodioli]|uniref:IS5 family transposase n=1 Tax=Candidatus Endonucleibacter bathymodioli TaxID=539814 RepID=A0AA90NRQ9_9GAMM|nr:IS5 family transposase [Candidatus Endonucleobacter bathymodioli]